MDTSEKSVSKFAMSNVISLLTFIIPLMYLCGYLYHAGYLDQYGINNDYFDLSFEAYLIKFFLFFIHAFSEMLRITKDASMAFAVVAFVFLYSVLLYGMHVMRRQVESWKRRLRVKYNSKKHLGWIAIPTLFTAAVVGAPLALIGVSTIAIVGILSSYSVGSDRAGKEVSSFIMCNLPESRCTKVLSDTRLVAEGRVITVSNKNLALFDGQKVIILENDNLRVETGIKTTSL
ncbi:hypothetical protein [Alishewanella longhuensis]